MNLMAMMSVLELRDYARLNRGREIGRELAQSVLETYGGRENCSPTLANK